MLQARLRAIINFAGRRPTIVVLSLVGATAAFAVLAATGLRVDSTVTDLLPADSQTRRQVHRYASELADKELMPIALTADRLLTTINLARIDRLIGELDCLPGVSLLASPFSSLSFSRESGRLLVRPLADGGRPPLTERALAEFLARLRTAPDNAHMFVSGDRTTLTLLFEIEPLASYGRLLDEIHMRLAAATDGAELAATIGGFIPIYVNTEQRIARDVPVLGGIAALLAVLVLLGSFGRSRALLLPLATVLISLVWIAGLMALSGARFTVISLMLPPLLFALGSSYGVHMLNHGAERSWEVAPTVVLAAATTAAGFFSLLVSGLPRLREFGIFAGVGILIAAAVTLLLAPVLLRSGGEAEPATRRIDRSVAAAVASHVATHLTAWSRIGVACIVAIAAGLAIAGGNLKYQTDVTQFFRGGSDAIEDNRYVMDRFGSFVSLQLTVTDRDGVSTFPTPALLAAISEFEVTALAHRHVTGITSLPSELRAMNAALTGAAEFPTQAPLINLFLRFLGAFGTDASSSGESTVGPIAAGLNALIRTEERQLTSQLWIVDADTGWFLAETELQELLEYLENAAGATFEPGLEAEVWGWSLVTLRVSQTLAREQLLSIGASGLLVFGIVALAFRSWRRGAAAMLPLATGLGLAFLVMSLFTIPLDALTISFASIAVGVGVDDAVHLLLHYRRAERGGATPAMAARAAVATAGRAIVVTSVAVVVGMGALAMSRFLPIAHLGVLLAVSLLGTTGAALTVLPTLLGGGAKEGTS